MNKIVRDPMSDRGSKGRAFDDMVTIVISREKRLRHKTASKSLRGVSNGQEIKMGGKHVRLYISSPRGDMLSRVTLLLRCLLLVEENCMAGDFRQATIGCPDELIQYNFQRLMFFLGQQL